MIAFNRLTLERRTVDAIRFGSGNLSELSLI